VVQPAGMGGDTWGEGQGALKGGTPEGESGGCLLSCSVPLYRWSLNDAHELVREPV
jgi:hypothetical protein